MAHKVQANRRVRILDIEVAVPADADDGTVCDEMSAHLSLNGIDEEGSCILDWPYSGRERTVRVDGEPEEGEVFHLAPESTLTPD